MERKITLLTLNRPSSIAWMSFSPGGGRLALANDDGPGEVLVIAVSSGEEVARYSKLAVRPRIDFRSDSELLIVHGDDCWLCDLTASSHQVLPLPHDVRLGCVRVSPDGTFAAIGVGKSHEGRGLLVLDLVEGSTPKSVRVPGTAFTEAVNFSPDGRFVSVVHGPEDDARTERLISVLDVRSGQLIRQLKLPWEQCYVYPIALEPQKRLIAAGWRSRVLLFNLDPPNDPLNAETLFGSDYGGVPMGWGQPVACYPVGGDREEGQWAEVREQRFSAGGRSLKVLCDDGEAVLMSVSDGGVLQRTLPPAEHKHRYSAQISRDGRVAVCGEGKTVLMWEVPWWGEA
jgi:WD40 repeat protein